MPLPTRNDVHVNAPLTNVSIAYLQEAPSVADRVFPVVPVQKRTDSYYIYNKADFMRIEATLRAPGTAARRAGYRLSTATYECVNYALAHAIADDIRDNADSVLNMDMDATRWLTQNIILKRDKVWASKFFATSVWDIDLTGGTNFTKWDDPASDPIKNVKDQQIAVMKKTGRKPNVMVIGAEVLPALTEHPDVIDRIKYSQKAVATEDLLAELFGVKEFIVGGLSEETSVEGNSTAAQSFLFGKHALLAYRAERPSLMEPSAGYMFAWQKSGVPAGGQGFRTLRMRDDLSHSDIIEVEASFDPKVVASSLGAFFGSAVS